MANPFFSIIIPTHNRPRYLLEALKSVQNQTFNNYEILVVDDSSNTETEIMINSLNNEQIKYFKNKRKKGGNGARNYGIFKANGKWIVFLDDDDIWLPSKLQEFYEKISSAEYSVGLIYSSFAHYIFEQKKILKEVRAYKEGHLFKDLLYTNWIGTFSVVAIRKDILIELNGLDEEFLSCQDQELYIRVAQKYKVDKIDNILTYYRVDPHTTISNNSQKRIQGHLMIMHKYKKYYYSNLKIRQKIWSKIFVEAIKSKNAKYIRQSLPWIFIGIFIDIKNILIVCYLICSHLFRKKDCRYD